jgi:hypothetical protein
LITPFAIPPGMTNDDTAFASIGRWENGSLVRFYNGNWQIKGGWERLTFNLLPGVCRSCYSWSDTHQTPNVAFGTEQKLTLWRTDTWADITPTGFVPGSVDGSLGQGYGTGEYGINVYGEPGTVPLSGWFPMSWSLSNYGGDLIANPRLQSIYMWEQDPTVVARPLTGAPSNVIYTVVTASRQVMALGCNEETSGVFNPLCIRFSDIENPDDWTTTPQNNAGEVILESGGAIVCGRIVGNYVWVWTKLSLFLGTFVGSPGQTWSFERIGSWCGAISPGAPVVQSQNAMWISPDRQFWQVQLGGAPAQVISPIRQMFVDNVAIGQDEKIIGTACSTYQEFTWFWPDARDGFEVSRSLTVSPDGWSRDILARSAYIDSGVQGSPIGVAPTGEVYWHEKGNSADGQPMVGWIESNAFYLGAAEGGLQVNGCWPDIKNQQGPLQLTVYVRERPQAPERVKGPWTLLPGQDKRSFRLAGRIARVRLDFNSTPAAARGGLFSFDVDPIGGR